MRSILAVPLVFLLELSSVFAFDFKEIYYPGSVLTAPLDIDGNTIVGQYSLPFSSFPRAFIYDGTTYSTFDLPGYSVRALSGIHGSTLVGFLYDPTEDRNRDFIYDSGSLTFINAGGQYPDPSGVDGNFVVGNVYRPTGGFTGYVYDGTLIEYFDYPTVNFPPGTYSTIFSDVDNSLILGSYMVNSNTWQTFLYDGETLTPLAIPQSTNDFAVGLDNGLVVGGFEGSGYFFDGMTMTKFRHPDGWPTKATGISGNNIIGILDMFTEQRGFLITVPEPSTIVLTSAFLVVPLCSRKRTR